jgi:hypothetical protein
MGEEHLSETQLERYRRRGMSPDELLVADTHIARCKNCREEAGRGAAGAARVESLQAGLRSDESRPVHLAYNQLAALVDGTLADVDREIAESHLAMCGECKADWLDVDLFKKSLATLPPQTIERNLSSWWRNGVPFRGPGFKWTPVRAAAAIACVALLVWVGSIPFRSGVDGSRRQTALGDAQQIQSPGGTESKQSGLNVELNDGGGRVALRSDGSVAGLPAAFSGVSEAVRLVLGGRPLALPGDLAGFAGRPGVLLGGDQPRPLFGPLSPVGTAVITDRPTLSWQPLAGAGRYEVSVYDGDFRPVAVSPPLSRTEWTVSRKLVEGAVYSWQVKAFTNGEDILAPKPPAPEARFKVLNRKVSEELVSAQHNQVGSHLALGILFARAGALDDAQRELRALAEANPQSPIPQRLLRELEAVRH